MIEITLNRSFFLTDEQYEFVKKIAAMDKCSIQDELVQFMIAGIQNLQEAYEEHGVVL